MRSLYPPSVERGEGGGLPYKTDGGARRNLRVEKAVLVPLRVFSLERSTAGAFAVTFRVLIRKILQEIFDNQLY